MQILSNDGSVLFEGSRRECRLYVRRQNLTQYSKADVVAVEVEPVIFEPEPEKSTNIFYKIFSK